MDSVRSSTVERAGEAAHSVVANIRLERRWRQRLRAQLGPFEDCIPWGLLIVDRNSRIVFATPYARALLGAECGLKASADTFLVERAGVNRALAELIRSTATERRAMASNGACSTLVGVPDRQGRTRFAVRLLPFDDDEDDTLVLVAIMDLMGGGQIERSKVAVIFGLSEREAEFAELFSEGCRLQEIAKRMGVALNTARVHLRNVFAKTGASNQVELARLFTMLPYLAGSARAVQRKPAPLPPPERASRLR